MRRARRAVPMTFPGNTCCVGHRPRAGNPALRYRRLPDRGWIGRPHRQFPLSRPDCFSREKRKNAEYQKRADDVFLRLCAPFAAKHFGMRPNSSREKAQKAQKQKRRSLPAFGQLWPASAGDSAYFRFQTEGAPKVLNKTHLDLGKRRSQCLSHMLISHRLACL